MTLPKFIETQQLVLRPHSKQDIQSIYKFARDREWGRYLTTPKPYHIEHTENFVSKCIATDWDVNPIWCIELDGEAIGGINVRFFYEQRIAELGYSVARSHWRKGICIEAAQAIITTAFDNIENLFRIRARADSRNIASIQLMIKLGMKKEGCLRSNQYENDQFIDTVICGLLRDEWYD